MYICIITRSEPLFRSQRKESLKVGDITVDYPVPLHQKDNLQLYELDKHSNEFHLVNERFNETMVGKGTIAKVEKVANKRLWYVCSCVLF